MKLLLEHGTAKGAKVTQGWNEIETGMTPADVAKTKGHDEVATLLSWRDRISHSGCMIPGTGYADGNDVSIRRAGMRGFPRVVFVLGLALCIGAGCSDDDGDGSPAGDAGLDDAGPTDMGPIACEDSSECDDSNACTVDVCDPELGCQNLPSCDDGDPCTEDSCDPASGCSTTSLLCVDLRADTNRDGRVDLTEPTDDEGEETWDETHGALLLANLDDDESACPTDAAFEEVVACHDAADTVVNGAADLADLARLRIAAWADAPDDAAAQLAVASPGAEHVRLFLRQPDGTFEHWPAPSELTAAQLRLGVEVGIEATDVARDRSAWDGFVDLTLTISGGTGPHGPIPAGTDTVRMRVAPLRFPHVMRPATKAHISDHDETFVSDLAVALSSTSTAVRVLSGLDRPWLGDIYHALYTAMPGEAGAQTMRINLMTTQGFSNTAPEVVFRELRGPDVAGLIGYDPSTSTLGDSGANLLIIPPHTHGGESWPYGRALRATGSSELDPAFESLLEANGVGPAIEVDGSWLLLPHVTNMVAIVPADSARGWAMLIADPDLGLSLLEGLQADGFGSSELFVGKERSFTSAAVSIDTLLADVEIVASSQEAASQLAMVKQGIMDATGLTDAEIISVPALFEEEFGGALVHFLPSLVSGIPLSDSVYLAPKPLGPDIDGDPFFETTFAAALAPLGLEVVFVDDWEAFHLLLGGFPNGVNVDRELPSAPTW